MKTISSLMVCGIATVLLLAGCGKDEDQQSSASLAGQVFGNAGTGAPQDPIAQLPPDSPVVTVNGTAVRAAEISRELDRIIAQIARNNNIPPQQFASMRPMMVNQAIESMINQTLLLA
ncbi:MAG: hypothetical protein GY869_00260, partial [Planctomycetes bacterium]|nr:hypothetical protein [Planctomycetota bacterium]